MTGRNRGSRSKARAIAAHREAATKQLIALLGWVSLALLCLVWLASTVSAQDASGVSVSRGSPEQQEQALATVTQEGSVTVVRGAPLVRTRAASTQGAYPAIQQTPDFVPLRGFAGWFVDYKRNRFGNCYRLSTGDYLDYEILCSWRPLPN